MVGCLVLGLIFSILVLVVLLVLEMISLHLFFLLLLGVSIVFSILIAKSYKKPMGVQPPPPGGPDPAPAPSSTGPHSIAEALRQAQSTARSIKSGPALESSQLAASQPKPTKPAEPPAHARPQSANPDHANAPGEPEKTQSHSQPIIKVICPAETAESEPPANSAAIPSEPESQPPAPPRSRPLTPPPSVAEPAPPLPEGVMASNPVSAEIIRKLTAVRAAWFSALLKALETFNAKKKTNENKIPISVFRLSEEIEVLMKAFQIHLLNLYLSQYRYLRGSAHSDFQEKLNDMILGGQAEKCQPYMQSFLGIVFPETSLAKPGQAFAPVLQALAGFMAAQERAADVIQVLAPVVAEFADVIFMECAQALGDTRTTAKMKNRLARMHSAWLSPKNR